MKKPPSAKSKAARAKREKLGVPEDRHAAVERRLQEAHDRSYPNHDKRAVVANDVEVPWDEPTVMEMSYPSERPLTEADFLTAEEAQAQEEKILGKKGVPDLNDDVPDFIYTAAKAGPPLDALGRKKDRKPLDAIALGDQSQPISRVTTIMKDHDLEYPDLYMAVFVVPDWAVPDDEARFARLFARSGCYRADTIEEADLVVFGGGSDVEPLLYGESNEHKHPSTYFNTERDAADMKIYLQARQQGTPMMGVCRGAQFLHVMNGGKLFQDIDGHQGAHAGFALKEKLHIDKISSVHHQSCIWNKEGGMEILMTGGRASERWLNADVKDASAKIDIEAFYYRDTGCFGVQGHPEYQNYNRYSVWCLEKINDLFLTSPDFCWEGKRLQMTPTARDASAIAAQYIENAYNQSKEA